MINNIAAAEFMDKIFYVISNCYSLPTWKLSTSYEKIPAMFVVVLYSSTNFGPTTYN
jgi:hypothetical protein